MVQEPQPQSHPGKTSQIRQQMAMVHRYHSSGINLLVITLRFLFVSAASQDPADAYNIICPETSQLPKSLRLSRFYGFVSLRIKANQTVSDTVIIGEEPNKLYTRFLCRGDDSRQVCGDCVETATNVIEMCNGTHALIWYDRCLVRYSVTSFFTDTLESSNFTVCDPVNISNSIAAEFMGMVNKTMYSVANGTSNNAPSKSSKPVWSNSQHPRHCTYWSNAGRTSRTLNATITKCDGRPGGKSLIGSSCTAWYKTVLFFDEPQPQASILAPVRRPHTKATYPGIKSIELLTVESLQYNLVTLQNATNYFSDKNKIGRGGFGIVYKGVLADGQEIAVKRLSTSSGQGAEEFNNEVILLAKLQHKNLVKLIGFCLAGEERLLVYEFVTNKSLDYYLFDHEKQGLLDWKRRYNIIQGIARGLLYLHEDSRLRIIHRDLKASNILLDADMNPKVSDFSTARLVSMDQSMNETRKVAGTLGYMAPEYLSHGQFSVKSDVYSFGVLVLEIISGKQSSESSSSTVKREVGTYSSSSKSMTELTVMDPR
ncbi:Cysteine-rich receptor-like protein [Drosera capensis]